MISGTLIAIGFWTPIVLVIGIVLFGMMCFANWLMKG